MSVFGKDSGSEAVSRNLSSVCELQKTLQDSGCFSVPLSELLQANKCFTVAHVEELQPDSSGSERLHKEREGGEPGVTEHKSPAPVRYSHKSHDTHTGIHPNRAGGLKFQILVKPLWSDIYCQNFQLWPVLGSLWASSSWVSASFFVVLSQTDIVWNYCKIFDNKLELSRFSSLAVITATLRTCQLSLWYK